MYLLSMPSVKSHHDFIHKGHIELAREIEKALLSKFVNREQGMNENTNLHTTRDYAYMRLWLWSLYERSR